jgi:hypothetical protein
MLVERRRKLERLDAVWQDHWKVIRLPVYPFPVSIDGRSYASGIECTSMDVFELGERGDSAEDFARFVAKMAYGYAVERYGLEAFERV